MEAKWMDNKAALQSRLRRVEGQLRGIQSMVEREEDCERIAQQLAAARKALDKAFFQMMACAMERGLHDAANSDGDGYEGAVAHFTELMAKYA